MAEKYNKAHNANLMLNPSVKNFENRPTFAQVESKSILKDFMRQLIPQDSNYQTTVYNLLFNDRLCLFYDCLGYLSLPN